MCTYFILNNVSSEAQIRKTILNYIYIYYCTLGLSVDKILFLENTL